MSDHKDFPSSVNAQGVGPVQRIESDHSPLVFSEEGFKEERDQRSIDPLTGRACFLLRREADTIRLGILLGQRLQPGDFICFHGDLGAGKTTMIQGIAKGMGIVDAVTSPTFLLVQEYEGSLPLFHFDAYRIEDPQELLDIGFDDYRKRRGVFVVEWAQLVQDLWPKNCLEIALFRTPEDQRKAEMLGHGAYWQQVLGMLKDHWESCLPEAYV